MAGDRELPSSKSPRFQTNLADLSDDGDPERVGGVEVSANLLPILGVQPILGRQFSAEEEQPGKDRVAIISYALWQRRFGGDAEIIGKTITVNRDAAHGHRRHARRL